MDMASTSKHGKRRLARDIMSVSHTAKRVAEQLISSNNDDDDDFDDPEESGTESFLSFAEVEKKADSLRRKQRQQHMTRSALSTATVTTKRPTTSKGRNVVSVSY